MSGHTPGPWVIDNRSHYDWPAGGHQAPLQLGAVVAECPTAFGGHTIRAPHTIGKPCPTKEDLDAIGLANATLIKEAPNVLSALKNLVCIVRDVHADAFRIAEWAVVSEARSAIAEAEGDS